MISMKAKKKRILSKDNENRDWLSYIFHQYEANCKRALKLMRTY